VLAPSVVGGFVEGYVYNVHAKSLPASVAVPILPVCSIHSSTMSRSN
jgi:hypothetical protein